MGHTPIEASDILEFTPPSLANLPSPPVFLLKPGTRRDREQYPKRLRIEGYQIHSDAAMRLEAEHGLRELWDEETFNANIGRLYVYWNAIDAHAKEHEGNPAPPPLEFDKVEQAEIEALIGRMTKAWEPLREMEADIIDFRNGSPVVMLSLVLIGWRNIDVSFAKAGGIVSLDKLEHVEKALRVIEADARAAKIEGIGLEGTAYLELCVAAGQRLFLSEAQEKNSSSPAQSPAIQPDSKENGQASESGKSKAPEPSPQTPDIS